ncbi:MAG: hypothetical protein NW220_02205 [Leptolyngbyaceae cyanobacterium bins.349]|nr:hypothetical protein [Leptolyngbyaceae cyanobacterium bins.349]
MSNSSPALNLSVEADGDRFPSLASLRAAHSDLLKRHREQGNQPEVMAEIHQLIQKGQATGALLDSEDDRWAAQSLLDYWTSLLYRVGVEVPDATLVDFDPSLAPELTDDLCPYLGLEAFRERNQHLFFGRQRLVDRLLKHLEANPLLIVVGASGSGKSSIVLGGLLPRLIAGALPDSQHWVYPAPLVPGSEPLAALARRLKPATAAATDWIPQQVTAFKQNPNHLLQLTEQPEQSPVVLVIDQFEEVFTLCRDQDTRHALIQNLIQFIQASPCQNRLILTMRTDFESQFVRTPELLALFEKSYFRVTALDANELRDAIEKPAALIGLKFEEGLVDALLGDVLGEPAALPLLQFTLLKLWDHRERDRVTWEAYRRLGGGRLALAKSADEFYNSLIPEEQVTVRRILLRMVRPGEGLEVTSNRIPRQDLYCSGEAQDRIDRVLEKLIQNRLVRLTEGDCADDAQVEVAHEALIRNWPRLVDWLEDERLTLRQRLRLTEAAEQWQARDKDTSLLWRGALLAEAQQYSDLNPLEQEFLQASHTAEARRRQTEKKQRQFQTWAIRGLVGLSLGTVCLLGIVIYQLQQAQRQRVALLTVTTKALLSTEPTEAAMNILAADGLSQSMMVQFPTYAKPDEIQTNLLDTVQSVQERNQLLGHEDMINSVAFSPDGKRIVSASEDTTLRLWHTTTGKPIGQPLKGHQEWISSVAFSPDGKCIVSASGDKTLRLWDGMTGKPIGQPLKGHQEWISSVAFSPDGQRIVSASGDKTLRLWDGMTGKPIGQPLQGHQSEIWFVVFSPDGKRIVSASGDRTLRLWDGMTGKPIGQPLKGQKGWTPAVAFSPDGKRIVSGSEDETLRLWDAITGKPMGQPLKGHEKGISSVAFSPDGKRIVSGSEDETLRLWDATTGKLIGEPLRGHQDPVTQVAFSWNGKTIVSGSQDKTLRLWDGMTGQEIGQPLKGHQEWIGSVAFSPDGKRIVSGSGDKTVRLWNAIPNQPIRQRLSMQHQDGVGAVAVSPDGKRIVSGSDDKTLRVWDAATGKPMGQPLKGHEEGIRSVAFSPDGKRIVSGSGDKTLRLWDAATGKPIGQSLKGHQNAVWSVAFSPDGKRIVSGSGDKTLRLWDAATGKLMGQPLKGHEEGIRSVAFSPDGKRMVSGSWDKTLRLWDATTGKPIGPSLKGHQSEFTSVVFSPDGKRIISGSWDDTLHLWDAATGKLIGPPLKGHEHWVWSVAFSPDGRRIASGSADSTIRLWDAFTGKPVGQPLKAFTSWIWSVAFSPDGQQLVSGGSDGAVRVWEVDSQAATPAQLVKTLCDRLKGHVVLMEPKTDVSRAAKATCEQYAWKQ